MMKKLTAALALVLIVGVLTEPAAAFSVPWLKHHMTGNVTAVDQDGRNFTMTDDKTQKSFNFDVTDPAMLTGLKKGEHVRVGYSKHGTQLLASQIAPSTAARTRSATK
jgi:Cu/Ag efflux protein CusF